MAALVMVLTGAHIWTLKDGTPHPTGFWVDEFVFPHRIFTAAGINVKVATPGGVTPAGDELSLSLAYNDNDPGIIEDQRGYLKQHERLLGSTLALESVDAASFDGVFIVGGHGPMQDLAVHPTLGDLLSRMLDDPDKVVAAVCHGVAGFLPAHRADGTWLFRGRELTGFSNEEETAATFAGNAPWLLEDRLRLAGARYQAKPAWSSHVIVDGNLVTGQNWESAEGAARAVLEQLRIPVPT